jgi:hypothetical protein
MKRATIVGAAMMQVRTIAELATHQIAFIKDPDGNWLEVIEE